MHTAQDKRLGKRKEEPVEFGRERSFQSADFLCRTTRTAEAREFLYLQSDATRVLKTRMECLASDVNNSSEARAVDHESSPKAVDMRKGIVVVVLIV